ncbi:uncharacterized protein LOC109863285 [Pseudomyrmex gracilis]|uniref:uncharacterized protein LOC109863285 n=1 Tax=Pseudomyrmex gracilis TaxID=219809 RepID=UPI000995B277|nr:uncharacterized protein LOC109863285 [Pseudomyrmex gracilis]
MTCGINEKHNHKSNAISLRSRIVPASADNNIAIHLAVKSKSKETPCVIHKKDNHKSNSYSLRSLTVPVSADNNIAIQLAVKNKSNETPCVINKKITTKVMHIHLEVLLYLRLLTII